MASLNKVILIGNLTADPELKQTQSGISVVSFTIAIRSPANILKMVDFPTLGLPTIATIGLLTLASNPDCFLLFQCDMIHNIIAYIFFNDIRINYNFCFCTKLLFKYFIQIGFFFASVGIQISI